MVTDADRAATPSFMDWSELGETSPTIESVVLATWKFCPGTLGTSPTMCRVV